jgi:type II secretory pathway component PulC
VLVSRPATHAQIDAFAAALMQKGAGLVPVLQADVRDRQQMLDMLQVLASMLSLKDETV